MLNRDVIIECTSDIPQSKCSKTIINDLNKVDLSIEIKKRANEIYNKIGQTVKRAKNRKLLLFFCVYNAYKELEINVDPSDIGKLFGLTHGEMQKSTSMFSPLQTGYTSLVKTRGIDTYVIDYCQKLGFEDDQLQHVTIFTDNLLKNHEKELSGFVSQTAAIGIIKYYLTINGIELDDDSLLAKVGSRSTTTIETVYKKICIIDNQ